MATTMREILSRLSNEHLTDEQVASYALDYIRAGMTSEDRDYLRSWLIYSRPDASIMVEEKVGRIICNNPFEPTFQPFRMVYNQAVTAAKEPAARDKIASAMVGIWAIITSPFSQELTERDRMDLDHLPDSMSDETLSSAYSQSKLLVKLSGLVPLLAEKPERFQA